VELEKQKLILSLVAGNRDLLALTAGIIKPSYFDPSLKKSVKFIQDYFEKYKDVPKLATLRAETGLILEDSGKITRADVQYVASEMEDFCKTRAATEAVIQSMEFIQKGEIGKIIPALKEAVAIGLQKDIGINYFENVEERLKQTLEVEARLSTGWAEVDEMLGGGVARQELIVFTANSGGGKSMTMLNLARNFLAQGYNGVYISLEMRAGVVSKRLDSMISLISQENLLREMQKVLVAIESSAGNMGKFFVKRMPENRTNINDIRSYLQQLEQSTGFRPDFIVVDYLDIMGTTMSVSHDNLFIKDKYVTEEVRSLGFDYDCVMVSASQLGKHAAKSETLDQSDVQGGSSKVNTSDYTIAVKQDDLMRAAGEIFFQVLKSRNSRGVGRRVLLGWDPISLLISSLQKAKNGLQLNKKKSPIILETAQGNDGVLGLMNT